MVEPAHPHISVRRQCQLLGISRASLYDEPQAETAENLELMRRFDEQYTRCPFYGVRRMTAWLAQQGYAVNEKRVRRLLRKMGLCAIYPKPRLSQPAPGAQVYPYLLRGLAVERVNQVWSTDITDIRLLSGLILINQTVHRLFLEQALRVTEQVKSDHFLVGERGLGIIAQALKARL
ncbi:MAG: IS3 family transposase [Acidobacteriota bacterium]|nr:IS3 family transposase [Acidobacteriota bacterium]